MITRTTYQSICNVLWVLTGLTICVASIQLKLGTFSDPGPGFMPFGTGLFLLLFSLPALLRKGLDEVEGPGTWTGPHWKRVITTTISLFAYALLLTKTGYLLTTLLLMIFLFRTPEDRKWMSVIMKAVISVGITYLVFDQWLNCQLPKGIFEF